MEINNTSKSGTTYGRRYTGFKSCDEGIHVKNERNIKYLKDFRHQNDVKSILSKWT
jgi:hypothetical protein